MLLIPNAVLTRYAAYLMKRGTTVARHAEYKKWLRYYLDFCNKFPVQDAKSERVRQFMEKPRSKKQTETRRQQTAYAVSQVDRLKAEDC
jgi:hypothetical protein